MNIRNISINIGKALLINALFMFISVIVSIAYGFDSGFTPLLICCIITFLTGAFPMIFHRSTSQDSLKKIAEVCGFDNYTYFSKLFKQKNGMSPREYIAAK